MGQTTPQEPQFVESIIGSTQVVPQRIWPEIGQAAATQVLPAQFWPVAHAWPHDPQLRLSVAVSTHDPAQSICPEGQVPMTQFEALQVWPEAQLRPHEPQFAVSVVRSTHSPEQFVRPDGQLIAVQIPSTHVLLVGQTVAQVPQ